MREQNITTRSDQWPASNTTKACQKQKSNTTKNENNESNHTIFVPLSFFPFFTLSLAIIIYRSPPSNCNTSQVLRMIKYTTQFLFLYITLHKL